jgi:multiple sugar transport system substrate-binding protein
MKKWRLVFQLAVMSLSFVLILAGCASNNVGGSSTGTSPSTSSGSSSDSGSSSSSGSSGGGSSSSADVVRIDYWGGWTGADLNIMKSLVDRFNAEQNEVHVEFDSQQWTPLFTKFLTEMRGGNPPDILAMHPFELGQFVEMDVLDPSLAAELNLNEGDYSQFAWNGTFYKGVQYGVPLDEHTHGLFYNKAKFAEAGITNVPQTGEELIAAARKLTVDANGKRADEPGFDPDNIVQYGLSFNMNHHIFYQTLGLLAQQNEFPFTADMTTVNIDREKFVNAITFLQDLVFKYNVVPKGEKSAVDSFVGGNVAMFIDGPWQIPKLEDSGIEWGAAKYPQVFGQPGVWGAAEILTFPKKERDEKTKQAIIKFITWLDANSGGWAQSGQLPSSKAGMEVAKGLEGREAFIESLDFSVMLPAHPKSTQLFSSAAPSPILTAAQDAVLNNKDASSILDQLKKDMEAILNN